MTTPTTLRDREPVTPRTDAGRVMAEWLEFARGRGMSGIPASLHILAIEEQAATEVRRELLAKVEGLPADDRLRYFGNWYIAASAVMGIFEDAEMEPKP